MQIEINRTKPVVEKPVVQETPVQKEPEYIKKLSINDISSENTYIEVYERKDENSFIKKYYTNNEDKYICPFCGRFHDPSVECDCDGRYNVVPEDEVLDIYKINMDIPYVDIFVNDVQVKAAK